MKRSFSHSDHWIPTERSMFWSSIGEQEEEDSMEELYGGGVECGAKKRRLSAEQVRELENSFEGDNKLEPERKVRLAQELGLQPRQVAVWFQNRRARSKTKQLEHDYAALKASHDAIRLDCDALLRDKETLLAEIEELKNKLADEDPLASEAEKNGTLAAKELSDPLGLACKDWSRDTDSSAVLNDALLNDEDSPRWISSSASATNMASATAGVISSFPGSPEPPLLDLDMTTTYHNHAMKLEEFVEGKECAGFFAGEQTPCLHWSYWN